MISHVVMFRPRTDVAKEDRHALLDAFHLALRDIPTIRGVRAGRRVRVSAGYERDSSESPDFVIAIDFDDVSGLQLYLQHPAHVELAARFSQACAVAHVYDFATTDDASNIRALFDAQ
jgi:hypothetical protein